MSSGGEYQQFPMSDESVQFADPLGLDAQGFVEPQPLGHAQSEGPESSSDECEEWFDTDTVDPGVFDNLMS